MPRRSGAARPAAWPRQSPAEEGNKKGRLHVGCFRQTTHVEGQVVAGQPGLQHGCRKDVQDNVRHAGMAGFSKLPPRCNQHHGLNRQHAAALPDAQLNACLAEALLLLQGG